MSKRTNEEKDSGIRIKTLKGLSITLLFLSFFNLLFPNPLFPAETIPNLPYLQVTAMTNITSCESTSDWSILAGSGTISVDPSDYKEGNGSIRVIGETDGRGILCIKYHPLGTWNLNSLAFLTMCLKLDSATNPTDFRVYIISPKDVSPTASRLWKLASRYVDEWNSGIWFNITLPLNNPDSKVGSMDPSKVERLMIYVVAEDFTSAEFKVDDIVIAGQYVKNETVEILNSLLRQGYPFLMAGILGIIARRLEIEIIIDKGS